MACCGAPTSPGPPRRRTPNRPFASSTPTASCTTKKSTRACAAAFANLFEAKHGPLIRKAFGEDHDALAKWLNDHPDLKENFYTALDERYDKLAAALALFRAIWQQFPSELEKYPELGIAVAVTWDDPRAVYHYRSHQVRTRSKMPDGLIDGLANFQYIVENEKVTEGRCRYMPWEFLVFVVDHATPLDERKWAQQYYQANRGSKSWHQDVPYDHDMLKGERAKGASDLKPKLQDQDYTLSNIRRLGGVCAMQADFAARVGKSVGIPAVYCSGESAYRGYHAWWMYVQILKATPEQMQFTLKSDGRFEGFTKDAFYTGSVTDPHTGQRILDRDMERRLALAGRDRAGKRHVDLLLRAYPWLQQQPDWGLRQRVAFLERCLRLSPQSDEPWLELAKLVKNKELQGDQKEVIRPHLASMLTQFKNYPDFVGKVYGDLLGVYEPADQVRLYQQAVLLFEKAGRPDLSCDARLKITDALARQKKWQSRRRRADRDHHPLPHRRAASFPK